MFNRHRIDRLKIDLELLQSRVTTLEDAFCAHDEMLRTLKKDFVKDPQKTFLQQCQELYVKDPTNKTLAHLIETFGYR